MAVIRAGLLMWTVSDTEVLLTLCRNSGATIANKGAP